MNCRIGRMDTFIIIIRTCHNNSTFSITLLTLPKRLANKSLRFIQYK